MAENEDERQEREERQKEMKKNLIFVVIVSFIGLLALIYSVSGNVAPNGKKSSKVTNNAVTHSEVADKELRIVKALEKDVFRVELGTLYSKYPEISEIILNRKLYPDSIIEYLISHEEALDWVVNYPRFIQKDKGEIDEIALRAVDISKYEVQNGIPLYYQWDETWGYASYGTGVMAISGCGPTALSMVATGLVGDHSMTPKMVANLSEEKGYYAGDLGTDWLLMTEGAAQLGIQSRTLNNNKGRILDELTAGHPIICSVGPGDFTDQGHFIVLSGVTEDGKIMVNDPNSRINSIKRWELDVLLEQMKASWAYSTV